MQTGRTDPPAKLLIVDDDPLFGEMISDLLEELGYQPQLAATLAEGRRLVREMAPDLVLLDVVMPDGNGLDLLPDLAREPCSPEILILTGEGDAQGAELAIKSGAWDYLLKTTAFDFERVQLAIERGLQHRQTRLRNQRASGMPDDEIVGTSPALRSCLQQVNQAAGTGFNVLITGETGTGKELFARAIHKSGPRAAEDLVTVDCTAIPRQLVESILFGHQKGAFTGAEENTLGLIKRADGGTLFLDEVGELSASMQKKLLRVLQERRFIPIGAKAPVKSDFCLISATNQDLEQLVQQGLFRQDLLFRLRSIVIEVPPLRERLEDIPSLALSHLVQLSRRHGRAVKKLAPDFLEALSLHDWPGNVRELFGVLESAYAAAFTEDVLYPQHLPSKMHAKRVMAELHPASDVPPDFPTESPHAGDTLPPIREYRRRADHEYLQALLRQCHNDMARSAQVSGLSPSRLYSLIKLHGLAKKEK